MSCTFCIFKTLKTQYSTQICRGSIVLPKTWHTLCRRRHNGRLSFAWTCVCVCTRERQTCEIKNTVDSVCRGWAYVRVACLVVVRAACVCVCVATSASRRCRFRPAHQRRSPSKLLHEKYVTYKCIFKSHNRTEQRRTPVHISLAAVRCQALDVIRGVLCACIPGIMLAPLFPRTPTPTFLLYAKSWLLKGGC